MLEDVRSKMLKSQDFSPVGRHSPTGNKTQITLVKGGAVTWVPGEAPGVRCLGI